MKLFPVHPILLSSLLVFWGSDSETEASGTDVCQDDSLGDDNLHAESSTESHVDFAAVADNFLCLLYPTNTLNCSWSFPALHKDSQLSVSISVCDNNTTVQFLNYSSEERVGSRCLSLHDPDDYYVIFQFKITQHVEWTVYTYIYDIYALEVLSPPENISASVKDGDLLVAWDEPRSREISKTQCFEYELDLGDQEKPKHLINQLSYTELNADPNCTYRVRVRTRQEDACQQNSQWSQWSQTITVEQPVSKLSTVVIISISLGIPMILLAVLLVVRNQRVSKVLFPPIPRPPPKYKCFLEKNDTFNIFHPTLSAEPEAEITEVEDTEQKPGKTF